MAIQLTGIYRTGLIRVAADRDDRFNRLIQKLIHVLGMMAGNINPDFLHHLNGQRMHIAGGLGPGALDVEFVPDGRAEQAFSEMAATGIAGAEDEDGGFVVRFHW